MLVAWGGGDADALTKVLPTVYEELHQVAAAYMRRERSNHTLQTTALIHEAYLRLVGHKNPNWKNRKHFYGAAARVMRRVLVDHARAHNAAARGGHFFRVPVEELGAFSVTDDPNLLALDEALNELERRDELQSRIVELRFFGGFSIDETAEMLGISTATATRKWLLARAWLYREMNQGEHAKN